MKTAFLRGIAHKANTNLTQWFFLCLGSTLTWAAEFTTVGTRLPPTWPTPLWQPKLRHYLVKRLQQPHHHPRVRRHHQIQALCCKVIRTHQSFKLVLSTELFFHTQILSGDGISSKRGFKLLKGKGRNFDKSDSLLRMLLCRVKRSAPLDQGVRSWNKCWCLQKKVVPFLRINLLSSFFLNSLL